MNLSLFAAESSGPSVHVAPLPVFEIAGITITNSILYGWITSVFIITFLIWVARRVTVKPQGGIVQFVEILVEFISGIVENAFNNAKIARKYIPFFVTVFFVIILNNWLGLMPFVGNGFKSGENPLLRPFTGDLNTTLAIGVCTMIFVYVVSIKESGGIGPYFRHFFSGSPKNPIYLVSALLEMLTDLTRVLSLSLRLFLAVTIGEIVIGVFAYLGGVIAPLTAMPFTILEIVVGAIQAYIFTILATMYVAIAVNHSSEHHEEDDLTADDAAETIELTAGSAHGRA